MLRKNGKNGKSGKSAFSALTPPAALLENPFEQMEELEPDDVELEVDAEVPAEVPARGKKGKKAQGPVEETIKIPELQLKVLNITVSAISPLIVHRFSEKAKREMAAKQQQVARHKRGAKEPLQDFLQSLYIMPGSPEPKIYEKNGETYCKGRFGFPAGAFKLAAVSACRHAEGITMAFAKGAFHVMGDMLEIHGNDPRMREDIVRLGGMRPVADLRYRGEFTDWHVDLEIQYNAAAINPPQIAHLLNLAGFAVGIGEWRPEKDGHNGMFTVANMPDHSGKAAH